MNKNNVFGIGILIIILMLVGGILIKVFLIDSSVREGDINKDGNNESIINLEQDGFDFQAEYKGDNAWYYKITGALPTPCHEVKDEALVAESFPEQVTVNLSIISPEPDIICMQVIDEINIEGTFSASPEAKVHFIVSNQ